MMTKKKKNVRLMWIATGAIVLFIIGLTGLSMLGVIGHPSSAEPTDLQQSVTNGSDNSVRASGRTITRTDLLG